MRGAAADEKPRQVLRLRGSGKRLQAVDAVDLTIRRGETLGLVGESGSGKTTVGRCLLRLIEPDSGEIIFDGIDLARASAGDMRRLRKRVQIVFQDPLDALDPRWTVDSIIGEAWRSPTRSACGNCSGWSALRRASLR